jgi:hypothetical protein
MNVSVNSIEFQIGDRKIKLTVDEARKMKEELDKLFIIERVDFNRNPKEITIFPVWPYWKNWQVTPMPIECEVPGSAGRPPQFQTVCISL